MDKQLGDVNFSGVMKAGMILLVVAVAVHLLMWLTFDFFQAREAREDPKPSPMFQKNQRPPNPQLQINEIQDYKKRAAAEDQILNSYGWVDSQKGVVRIPISEAMKLVVQKEKAAAPPEPCGGRATMTSSYLQRPMMCL